MLKITFGTQLSGIHKHLFRHANWRFRILKAISMQTSPRERQQLKFLACRPLGSGKGPENIATRGNRNHTTKFCLWSHLLAVHSDLSDEISVNHVRCLANISAKIPNAKLGITHRLYINAVPSFCDWYIVQHTPQVPGFQYACNPMPLSHQGCHRYWESLTLYHW